MLAEGLAEAGVVFEEPGAGGLAEAGDFVVVEDEGFFDFLSEGSGIDEEVGAEVSFFGALPFGEEAVGGGDEFVHGWGIGGDDDGAAAHGLDEVVAPALGLGGAKVEWVLVGEFDDFLIAEVGGDEVDVFWDVGGGVVGVLEEGEGGPIGMPCPGGEDGGGAFEGAATGEMEE